MGMENAGRSPPASRKVLEVGRRARGGRAARVPAGHGGRQEQSPGSLGQAAWQMLMLPEAAGGTCMVATGRKLKGTCGLRPSRRRRQLAGRWWVF